jgi:hypothetical protein
MNRAVTASLFAASVLAMAPLAAETPAAAGQVMSLTATTANVGGAPGTVRIEILRWSTDEERGRLMDAWNLKLPAPDAGDRGRGPGRGPGRGLPAKQAPLTPAVALARALQETTTIGYLWSSEIAGYALRFAEKVSNPDGSQRIILITDRRLGTVNRLWTPTSGGTPNKYQFSVIELRLNSKEAGEGKVSLTGKVAPDPSAHIVAIEGYDGLPVVFAKVRKEAVRQ